MIEMGSSHRSGALDLVKQPSVLSMRSLGNVKLKLHGVGTDDGLDHYGG